MMSAQKSVINGSTGLANLLRQRGFMDFVPPKLVEESHLVDYGPLGTLLRQNILKQWWNLMVTSQTNVFPVEGPLLEGPEPTDTAIINPAKSFSHLRNTLQNECAAKYQQVLKLTNGKLPISVASVGTCFSAPRSNSAEETAEKSLLLGSSLQTKLVLQNYIAPSNANAIQDYWLRTRLSWWKKFSRSPERFSVMSEASNGNSVNEGVNDNKYQESNSTNGSAAESCMNIVYEFPWGQETVESVNNLSDKLFKQTLQNDIEACMIKLPGKKAILPACIECDTSIESALAACLVDAYHERRPRSATGKKNSRSKVHQVLQLHHQISPYQVAIAVSSSPSSSTSSSTGIEMRYICDNLEKDLKNTGISVFNTSHHGGSLDAHYRRNDQLGIPYTVIVDQNTVTEGVVDTRSRDTQVKVSSHISRLVSELSRNLNAQLD